MSPLSVAPMNTHVSGPNADELVFLPSNSTLLHVYIAPASASTCQTRNAPPPPNTTARAARPHLAVHLRRRHNTTDHPDPPHPAPQRAHPPLPSMHLAPVEHDPDFQRPMPPPAPLCLPPTLRRAPPTLQITFLPHDPRGAAARARAQDLQDR